MLGWYPLLSFQASFKNRHIKTLSLQLLEKDQFWRGCPGKLLFLTILYCLAR